MTRDTRIALFLMGVLVTALRDNGPNPIKRSMFGGVHDQGGHVVEELLLDCSTRS